MVSESVVSSHVSFELEEEYDKSLQVQNPEYSESLEQWGVDRW